MGRKFVDQQPGEVYSFCDGYRPLRDANRLLKAHGLVIRYRGHSETMGDGVFLRIETLPGVSSLAKAAKELADAADATGDCDHKRLSCADVGCIGEQVRAVRKALKGGK